MANKKTTRIKEKSASSALPADQSRELEMILDRLQVQDPQGKTLDGYLQSLRTVLSSNEGIVVVLLERLSKQPSQVGFRVFSALGDLFQGKEFRRAVKQAGYRFRQAGFAADPEAVGAREATLIPSEVRQPIARMAFLSEEKLWLLAIVVADEPGRILFSLMVQNPMRFLELKATEISLRNYRQFLQETAENYSCRFYELPIWHAARLVFDVMQFGREAGSPENMRMARKFLAPFYDPERLPYVYELMPELKEPFRHQGEIDLTALLSDLVPDALPFSKQDLTPFWERIHDVEHSILVVPPAVKEERVRAIMDEAADRLCSDKTAELLQRYFEEQTMLYKLSGKDDLARSAWITAQLLRGREKPSANPVIVKLIGWSCYHHWPEEFNQDRSAGREAFHQSESGLVIPGPGPLRYESDQ